MSIGIHVCQGDGCLGNMDSEGLHGVGEGTGHLPLRSHLPLQCTKIDCVSYLKVKGRRKGREEEGRKEEGGRRREGGGGREEEGGRRREGGDG